MARSLTLFGRNQGKWTGKGQQKQATIVDSHLGKVCYLKQEAYFDLISFEVQQNSNTNDNIQ